MKKQTTWLVLLLGLLLTGRPTAAQGVVFQEFYWDTEAPAGQSWWAHIERQLPDLARAGIGSVWVPAPYKGGAGKYDMGYGPYDLYDLGSKYQKGTVATRFGTKDEFLRFVAAAHRLGIRVYADVVFNHASGADYAEPNPVMARLGWNDIPDQSQIRPENRSPEAKPGDILRSWTGFAPKGADGKPGTGRFPRTWRDFHPNEAEPDRDPPYHQKEFGEDYAFHGGERLRSRVADRLVALVRGADGRGRLPAGRPQGHRAGHDRRLRPRWPAGPVDGGGISRWGRRQADGLSAPGRGQRPPLRLPALLRPARHDLQARRRSTCATCCAAGRRTGRGR